jgi:transposase
MKRTTKYVGLDVHQATTVACVREESGRILTRAVVPTEETAILEFFGGMRGSVHVAFEEGTQAQWLDKLPERGVRFRAESLSRQLDVLKQIRQEAKAAMLAEARKDPAWERLLTIPFLGPVRVALLLAVLQTPWRFRTKRNLWAYCGFAVVTHSSADYALEGDRVVRRRRGPLTRGLNRNCNRRMKDLFKAAASAAAARPGPLQEFYLGMVGRGMKEELARVTLARKLAALTLRIWKTGEHYDASKLSTQLT